jgi:hypothetical protein
MGILDIQKLIGIKTIFVKPTSNFTKIYNTKKNIQKHLY